MGVRVGVSIYIRELLISAQPIRTVLEERERVGWREMFSLRDGLSLEMSKLSRMRSSRFEEVGREDRV